MLTKLLLKSRFSATFQKPVQIIPLQLWISVSELLRMCFWYIFKTSRRTVYYLRRPRASVRSKGAWVNIFRLSSRRRLHQIYHQQYFAWHHSWQLRLWRIHNLPRKILSLVRTIDCCVFLIFAKFLLLTMEFISFFHDTQQNIRISDGLVWNLLLQFSKVTKNW